jgi:patatin-like phospholipase/acyl hydrolase
MTPFRILALDGGGIRGVITAAILERLELAQPGFMKTIDLFAGTSTGGILALGLASGMSPTDARLLYERSGSKIFAFNIIDEIRDLGQLIGADYSNSPLKVELVNKFGDMTLGDLPKKVVISSFELDNKSADPSKPRNWKPKFFHNFPGPDSDADQKVIDVALRTSAAPTYFPIYQGYVDGGVVANNPSLCALAQAMHPDTGKQKLRDIRLLSIGTGLNPKYIPEIDANWGLVQWAPHLISLILEGSVGLADYQCKQLLSKYYYRVNPILPVPIGLDKVDQIPLMKDIAAKEDLSAAIKWSRRNFQTPRS